VDHAALSSRHGIHVNGMSGGDGSLRYLLSLGRHLPGAAVTVLLNVDDNRRGLVLQAVEDHVDEELERAKGLATVTDDEPCVLALNINHSRRVRPRARAANRRPGVDLHEFQHLLNDTERHPGTGAVASDGGYFHPSGLRTDAKDARAAVTDDVDLHLVAAYAEFEEC
jgi:hypothetical protein